VRVLTNGEETQQNNDGCASVHVRDGLRQEVNRVEVRENVVHGLRRDRGLQRDASVHQRLAETKETPIYED
jgi:hypothetical protein